MKPYRIFEKKEVTELHFNYKPACSDGKDVYCEEWNTAKVGDGDVMSIHEHLPEGEGDRLYYDIVLTGGKVVRTFNPCKVYFNRIEE
jgi:hypothetical protein